MTNPNDHILELVCMASNAALLCYANRDRGVGSVPSLQRFAGDPIALADHERARERSVFALQQIITRGVAGTSMPGFVQLSDEDRWALAYFASTLSYFSTVVR